MFFLTVQLCLFCFCLEKASGQPTWGPDTFLEHYVIIPGQGDIHPVYYDLPTLITWLKFHPHNNPVLRPGVHPFEHPNLPTDQVDVELYFQAVGDVDSMDMNFITTVYLQQVWYDRRLNIQLVGVENPPYISVHYSDTEWLWKPDTFFKNELESLLHANTRNNVMIRIYKNGTVYYSRKISMTLSCQMLLQRFPFDEQDCGLRISSFSYTNKELKYHWHRNLSGNGVDAVRYNHDINLPEYQIMGVSFTECEDKRFNLTYSCLDATMHIARAFSYYIMQVYIPSGLVVFIACLSFWIDPNAVPARITLGLVSVVTIATQRSGLTSTTPRVPYMRAIDVWMAVCLLITMAAMIEYSLVNTLQRRSKDRLFYAVGAGKKEDEKTSDKSDDFSNDVGSDTTEGSEGKPPAKPPKPNAWQRVFGKYEDDEADYVDSVSRAIFPMIFVVFNFAYWIYYMLIFTEHPALS